MNLLQGKRLAVAGMGVSGLAMAKAALAHGAEPVVFDQKNPETPAALDFQAKLQALDVATVTGWNGRLDPAEFDLLALSPGFKVGHPCVLDMVAGGKEVIGEVELAYRLTPCPVLAVTGTNGKTTVAVMMSLLGQAAGFRAQLCGNTSGSGYGEVAMCEAVLLDPAPEVLAAEVSSAQLESIVSFRPLGACLTNITEDHLDRYGTMERYREAKLRMYKNMGEGDTVVVCSGAPLASWEDVVDALPQGVKVVMANHEGPLPDDPRVVPAHVRLGPEVSVWSGLAVPNRELNLVGRHNWVNAAAAWEMVCSFIGPEQAAQKASQMVEVFRAFRAVRYRMEVVAEHRGLTFINNSMCTNAAAAMSSSKSILERQWLLMEGNPKDGDYRELGEYLRGSGHQVLLFGSNAAQLAKCLGGEWRMLGTMEDAFRYAVERAVPGDVVMLSPSGASTPPYANFRERGDAFDQLVREWVG